MVTIMEHSYLKRLPQWYTNNETEYDLVLSDDLDGLVATAAIKSANTDWHVNYFYDFDGLYICKKIQNKKNKSATRVWTDIAYIGNEMTFDNHVTLASAQDSYNRLSINPNIFGDKTVSNENYYDKYCGSTALMVWSIYNLPLPESELGKMLLLAIDSTFKGYYAAAKWHDLNKHFIIDVFGFEDLYAVQQRHTEKEFLQLAGQYQINRKIYMNNGKIKSELDIALLSELLGIDLSLPLDDFINFAKFESTTKESSYTGRYIKNMSTDNILTAAFTGKNKIKYSILKSINPVFDKRKNGVSV
ncbi:MAG: hypothetical protein LUD12_16045 [Lachnospiraceae bacterium]|nr:hypothetical protein [Lachnospiraceae bacterium]